MTACPYSRPEEIRMIASKFGSATSSPGVVARHALCAVAFVFLPVRAASPSDKPRTDATKEAEQTLPKSLNAEDGFADMRTSIRNLKQFSVALHDWAAAHQLTAGKTDHLADAKSALNSAF